MSVTLDDVDRKILELLQQNALMTNAEIGLEVGMSAPSVFERIRKLKQRRVIQRFTAIVDPAAVGKTLTAFIRLTVAYDEKHDAGIAAVSRDPDVLEFYNVAGEDCFLIKTRVGSAEELRGLINRIRAQVTVQRSVTMIALSAIKENAPLCIAESGDTPAAKPRVRARP